MELWEIEVSKQLKERESVIERMSEELENVEKERVSLVCKCIDLRLKRCVSLMSREVM